MCVKSVYIIIQSLCRNKKKESSCDCVIVAPTGCFIHPHLTQTERAAGVDKHVKLAPLLCAAARQPRPVLYLNTRNRHPWPCFPLHETMVQLMLHYHYLVGSCSTLLVLFATQINFALQASGSAAGWPAKMQSAVFFSKQDRPLLRWRWGIGNKVSCMSASCYHHHHRRRCCCCCLGLHWNGIGTKKRDSYTTCQHSVWATKQVRSS